jgi:hypothetical protein
MSQAKTKLTKKIIFEDYKEINFDWMTKECGHAEFILVPMIKRNKIREVHIVPLQQPNAKEFFVMENKDGWDGIFFGSSTVWTSGYDKKLKTFQFRFYVPKESKSFFITTGAGHCFINWR